MARLDYRHKTFIKIWLVAIIIVLSLFVFTACNNNSGTYDLSNVQNVDEITSSASSSLTGLIRKALIGLNDKVGNFGWTVVVFTIILRLILSPLDIWQKIVARRNAKAMKRMKPQLEALQAKYGEDKQRLQMEQQQLYKKEHYSMLGACLPTILTLVVFFLVFAGFRDMVGYQYARDYQACRDVYNEEYNATLKEQYDAEAVAYSIQEDGIVVANAGQDLNKIAKAADYAVIQGQNAVADYYNSKEARAMRGWIYVGSADRYLINNIFVQDGWKTAVPDYTSITGQSGFATARVVGFTADEYNTIMAKVIGTGGWGKNGKWNGLLLLPILSIVVGFLSQFLTQKSQGQPPAQTAGSNQGTMKMMQYFMPIMIGVFALLYSGAFTIYMFVSSLMAITFQLAFNGIGYLVDLKRGEAAPISFKSKKE